MAGLSQVRKFTIIKLPPIQLIRIPLLTTLPLLTHTHTIEE